MKVITRLIAVLLLLGSLQATQAQLTTTIGYSATDLAEALVGSGVTISGATMTCPFVSAGKFDGTASALPIDSGIMLASGAINTAIGPNDDPGAGTDEGFPGDPDLDALPGVLNTNDACVLEFDVEVLADTLKFNYVFGSEEYLEFVNLFNDVFAFWISGPGYPIPTNIALVPGTPVPVTINNVNNIVNPAYYQDNGDGFTPPFSVDPTYLQYDGYTTVLEARAVVQPCMTYHLKLAIADELDFIYDSGVFIEAGSLVSSGVTLSSSTSVGFGFANAIEGCVDGIIHFVPDAIPTDTQVVYYSIGGTASNGVDYVSIADSIVILPGTDTADLVISPIVDPIPEGDETVVIYLVDPCYFLPYDSVSMIIQDEIVLDLVIDPATTICPGDTVDLSVTGGLDYIWTPITFLSTDIGDSTMAWPPVSQYYTVTTELGTCTVSDSILVDVSVPPVANAGPDLDLCIGLSIAINGSGGANYTWDPPTALDDPNVATPITSTTVDQQYILTVTDAAGCWDLDSMMVYTHVPPSGSVVPLDAFICPDEELQLTASGGDFYTWTPSLGLDDPLTADPILTAVDDQVYQVVVSDIWGCTDTLTVDVMVDDVPVVDAGDQQIIDFGQSLTLAGDAPPPYFWTPEESLSDPNILNPVATPESSTWYVLSSTSAAGCVGIDSVFIIVVEPPPVIIPNAFTPNGDGLHDVLHPVVLGDLVGEISFTIVNRWGETVFRSNDANSGWDGTYKGKPQELGSYVYIFVYVDPAGNRFETKGTISLMR
jgi:gliding motility-associated-like protein